MSYNRELAFRDALREAMSATVTDTLDPQGSSASNPAAGTAGPEGVTVHATAADRVVTHYDPTPYDDDGVEDLTAFPSDTVYARDGRYALHNGSGRLFIPAYDPDAWTVEELSAEHERQARLRRWQAVGERRT